MGFILLRLLAALQCASGCPRSDKESVRILVSFGGADSQFSFSSRRNRMKADEGAVEDGGFFFQCFSFRNFSFYPLVVSACRRFSASTFACNACGSATIQRCSIGNAAGFMALDSGLGLEIHPVPILIGIEFQRFDQFGKFDRFHVIILL